MRNLKGNLQVVNVQGTFITQVEINSPKWTGGSFIHVVGFGTEFEYRQTVKLKWDSRGENKTGAMQLSKKQDCIAPV